MATTITLLPTAPSRGSSSEDFNNKADAFVAALSTMVTEMNQAIADLNAGVSSGNGSYVNFAYSGTLTGGTGVVNLGSNQFYKDANGNIGIGVVPSAWSPTLARNIDLGAYGGVYATSNNVGSTANAYWDGTNWKYKAAAIASAYQQSAGVHTWSYAAAGAAGGNITWTNFMVLGVDGNLTLSGTGALKVHSGTTAQRPASPAAGMFRFNTTLSRPEMYLGSAWGPMGGATGGGTDAAFYLNDATINTSYTIPTNQNAMTAGPISISNGVVVTVPDGSTWTIV